MMTNREMACRLLLAVPATVLVSAFAYRLSAPMHAVDGFLVGLAAIGDRP